jgi:hypothetical protein
MRLRHTQWCAFFAVFAFVHFVSPPFARAQAQFNCGSTGALGSLVVNTGQTVILNVPNDGIFHYTTITVSGALRFNRNPAFNPPVHLLSTGDLTINTGGSIQVNGTAGTPTTGGLGGPGGFDGGEAGIAGGNPGAGHGPGAGGPGTGAAVAGNAAYGGAPFSNQPTDGVLYGSPLLIPLVGGSGGGGDDNIGGGGGGGALLLCSPTRVIINGSIHGFGGSNASFGVGSGGAIRIVSPFVGGTGTVSVRGGGAAWAGEGRVRVDLIDRSGFTIAFEQPSVLSVGSFMSVFPSTTPRLDIVHVAGNDIPPGTPAPLAFTLPFNSQANQPIRVRATGFLGQVPIAVVVTPASGPRIVAETEIDMDVSNEATVNVDLPQNIVVRVHAWTR